MTPQEAVEAPRWRSLQNPMESTVPHTCEDVLQLESRFPDTIRQSLRQKGHDLRILSHWGGPGNAQAIQINSETGTLMGLVQIPGRDGYAIAF